MTVINQPTCTLFTEPERFTQLSGYYEAERRTVWMMLRAQPRPCFNHALIEEIMNLSGWSVSRVLRSIFGLPARLFLKCTTWEGLAVLRRVHSERAA